MRAWFDSAQDLVGRLQGLTPSALTSACSGVSQDPKMVDVSGNERIFALHPLSDADGQAVRHTQRGVRLLREGRIDNSLQELHDAKQQAPRSHEACSNLGCAYHMAGDDNAALYWYRQAHDFEPKDETALLALAILEQRRGQLVDAQKLLVKFLQEVDSSHVDVLRQLGKLHQQQAHWSQAGGCFHRLISIEPSNNEWPAQLQMCLDQVPLKDEHGQTVHDGGQTLTRAFSFAEPILRQAIPVDSREACRRGSDPGGYSRQACASAPVESKEAERRAQQSSDQWEVESPEEKGQRSPTNTHVSNHGANVAPTSFARVEQESPPKSDSPPRPDVLRGAWAVKQSFRMGSDGEEDRFAGQAKVLDKRAISSANTAVEQLNKGSIEAPDGFIIVYSSSSRAYFLLYRNDAKDVAYAKFKRIMEQGPPDAAVQLQEADRLRGSGRSDAALAVYRNVLRSDPRNAEAVLGVANCQCDLGDHDAAVEAGRQLISLKPEQAEANLRFAELLLVARQAPHIVEPFLERVAMDSHASQPALQHRLLCAVSETALAQDDLAKALTNAAEAVRIDSTANPLVLLGAARLRVAEYPAALRALTAALDACKGSPSLEARRLRATAHMLSAQAHERQRQYPQALAQAQAALELRPQFGDARVVKAMALHQSGRGQEAWAELLKVLQHEPQHVAARLQTGCMKLLDNDVQGAIDSFEAVLNGSAVVPGSMLGTVKIYLALALASQQQPQHAGKMLLEGLAQHKNLQHVWGEIERGLASQPTVAVQRLRSICDLDLSSQQARQMLALLAQVHNRADIVNTVSGLMPAGGQRPSRAPSVPPNRWAPTSPADVVVATGAQAQNRAAGRGPSPHGRMRSVSPEPWGVIGGGGATSSSMPGAGYGYGRGRSVSPGTGGMYYGAGAGVPGPPRQRAGSADSQEARGRTLPVAVENPASTSITLAWDEVIRPEQITYGQSIGAGGSASVYRGTWNSLEVAVKKISGLNHLEEMKKEINALRRLRHPRLVRFMGACIQPPQLLVVTEFMAGGSLHDHLFGKLQDPPLSAQDRWQVSVQTAEGLAFLHSNRVVHRDLKSMNILLDAANNAKICDFGLAHQMEATHIARKGDGEGGSPRYMAPECYEASYGKLTEKVDIWAMGCIFIEIFGNKLPYSDCQTMAQLSARILVERKPPELPSSMPAPLLEVAKQCLLFDERRRINSSDLHAELGKVRRQLKMG